MKNLKLTLVQAELVWEDKRANMEQFELALQEVVGTGIIILPEMFTTAFSMNPEALAEPHEGEALQWMRSIAQAKQCAITGSIMIKDGGQFFNRLYFVYPNGEYLYYNKRHCFSYAGEDKIYTQGQSKLVVNYKGWKIAPFICYDLRFPVWCRNTENVDLMLFVANWPSKRIEAWVSLLKARAIENMCFTVGVNRVGLDGNRIAHNGYSSVYDELGNKLVELIDKPMVKTISLDKEDLEGSRKRFGFLNDADTFTLD